MFGLDALQMRNQVQMTVAQQYDVTSVWVLTRQLLGVIGLLMLTFAGWRSLRSARRVAPRNTPRSDFIVPCRRSCRSRRRRREARLIAFVLHSLDDQDSRRTLREAGITSRSVRCREFALRISACRAAMTRSARTRPHRSPPTRSECA
jgi:hypothetical protein